MTRRIVLVGATSGMGRSLARSLAEQAGNELVLVGRAQERVAALAVEIPSATVLALDVSTRAGSKALVDVVRERWGRLDVLVNNAGVMTRTRQATSDGLECNLAVHHLAPYWVTTGLLDQLHAARGRVVNVNSAGHAAPMRGPGPVEIDFEDLQSTRGFDPFLVYSRSKLANLLFSYELARREPGVTVAALHPGVVRTRLGREFPKVQVAMVHALALSADQGAAAIRALVDRADLPSGSYFDRFRQAPSSAASYRIDDALRLWRLTGELTRELERR